MNQLNFADARHLTVRTGMGEEWNIIKQRQGKSRSAVINQLVKTRANWTKPAPKLAEWEQWRVLLNKGDKGREIARKRLRMDKQNLQEWWLNTMLETQHPLIERMVMFWHNHFTSSMDKVNQPSLILKQNRLFRQYALGNFGELLHKVVEDPAMLIYLDCNVNSNTGEANENFARELMELYTIGEGHYTENDVRNVAKAFTGWSVDRDKKTYIFKSDEHFASTITVLGKTGKLSGHDIVNLLLKRPETATNIAKKFWKEFINDGKPDPKTINAWARHFQASNYEISELLKVVLNSQAFWTPKNRGAKIKSPVELLVGTLRSLPIHVPVPKQKGSTRNKRLTDLCQSLGQKLFVPPDPAGWPGGNDWIDTDTLSSRKNMLANFTNLESKNTLDKIPHIPVAELSRWLLAAKPTSALPKETDSNQKKINTLVLDSAYQLT